MDREMEAKHLSLADRHIAEGEARIRMQEALIARLTRGGYDIAEAQRFLDLLHETLASWRSHRLLIAQTLAGE